MLYIQDPHHLKIFKCKILLYIALHLSNRSRELSENEEVGDFLIKDCIALLKSSEIPSWKKIDEVNKNFGNDFSSGNATRLGRSGTTELTTNFSDIGPFDAFNGIGEREPVGRVSRQKPHRVALVHRQAQVDQVPDDENDLLADRRSATLTL